MIKDNQKHLNRFNVLSDILFIIASYVISWCMRFQLEFMGVDSGHPLTFADYMMALLAIVPLYMALYSAFGLYAPKRVMGRRFEMGKIIRANITGMAIILAYLYLSREADFSRLFLFTFFAVNTFVSILEKMGLRWLLRTIRRRGFNQKHILLVGYSRAAESFIDRVLANPQWGYKLRGILDDNVNAGHMYKGVMVLGKIDNLDVILPQSRLDEIAITLGLEEYYKLEKIVNLCEKSGVHTKFIPDYNNIIPTKPYTEDLVGLPVVNIRYVPLTNTFNMIIKRMIDVAGAIFAIALFSPVMLTVAILIKITSKGPIIYKQERVGLHNKPFKMYKFRSMEMQKPDEEKRAWTVRNDPRVTRIGKFIRKTSIDELPQFFNVLTGRMSLVGPRPERPLFVEKFREEVPRYMIKHQVRPGLTGWAQVNGYRGDTSIRKRIEYDLYYIENWTVGFDFKIIFLTVFRGFINKNAY